MDIQKMYKVELAVIIMGVFLLTIYFSDGSVTGFATVQSFDIPLDTSIIRSERFELRGAEPFSVSALSISGEIIGEGAVVIELVSHEGKKIVYSNLNVDPRKINLLTTDFNDEAPILVIPKGELAGYPARKEGQRGREGVFDECGEACKLHPAWNQQSYELQVFVEPGTTVLLRRARFTS